jgi:cell division initiation protein
VAKEFEHLIQDTRRSKEQVLRHQKQLSDYMDLERTLKQTLQSAQRSTNESRVHAEKEAALIVKQAELDGERIVEQAREEARQLMEEVRELRKAKRQLRIELKTVLEGYQDLLAESAPKPARAEGSAPKAAARQAPPPSQPPRKPAIEAASP